MPAPFLETDIVMGATTALIGPNNGRYPFGNSVLVAGSEERVLIDPSLGLVDRPALQVDRMLVSHAHEDHLAGVHLHPYAPLHAHHDDVAALRELDALLDVYGMPEPMRTTWGRDVITEFHYSERADAAGFSHGQRFDVGGASIDVVHLPGHTRGHCGFMIEPDGVFFVADIDLSAFGPYYGDHWSDLSDFEQAIATCRTVDARFYATFHHRGVVAGREEFLRQLDIFEAVIGDRERRLLEFLAEPRTMDDIVEHRFVYRKDVQLVFADHVERTSMGMHVARLLADGRLTETEPGKYRAS